MPSRRSGGVGTTRRKHSLGNLRRAHPASGATWNVQVVRGKMSSKCLWHACRALILGLTLMLVGAGMATLGYYADHLSMGSELRGNVTVRVKNDLKGFHLNNFSYVGPIVMGFGGFIVVASCVMTFEARDSAAKVVPARLRAGGGSCNKSTARSNQGSSASQRRGMGAQYQSTRWDQHFGVFRSSPGDAHQQLQASGAAGDQLQPHQQQQQPFDREALTAELIKFSKSLSSVRRVRTTRSAGGGGGGGGCGGAAGGAVGSSSRIISNSSSLIQRNTREYATCTLLQPPAASRVYWQASSFDAGMGGVVGVAHSSAGSEKRAERNKRSDTAKRHVLSRQRPIEHEEAARERERCSPLGHRRNSTMSDSSYSGRWTARCASVASRTSSIDSRQVRVDLHSPEVMPKSILRSPKRYSCGPSATPSVEKDFRSQLSVCSEPPPPVRQLSGQSSMEPAVPEESVELIDERHSHDNDECHVSSYSEITELAHHSSSLPPKKQRPDFLPLGSSADHQQQQQQQQQQSSDTQKVNPATLYRSNSSRQFYRPKPGIANERDDSVFYIRSLERHASSTSGDDHMYDSLRVINERRSTLLKADSQSSLGSAERKLSSFSLKMPDITERENSIDIEDPPKTEAETLPKATTDEEKPQEET
ncbi:uncharacterized protein LOC133840193 isoform X2 [Drosophila sulfurigaster albostrigata]|uniref:uncharacterized protein LOC133840193 isoform X2 n=1 Tax=Drosophila sulfurigaster albostrigata TaxID=89887 RepID=UPI002D219064|nr:uncharacterized protein LOC133840193 isoform X2 [Drosophila sulfurigaster albostrigata]